MVILKSDKSVAMFLTRYFLLTSLSNICCVVSSFQSSSRPFFHPERPSNNCLFAASSTSSVPAPPWSFQASRIFYQFQAIPSDNARTFCPPCSGELQSPLTLLSVGGYTLGGIFCVEYEDSPIGPYREVAILSSLVARVPAIAIGAWASHIFVDSQDAADYGRDYWGLPATVVPIQFADDDDNDEQSCYFSDKEILVSGWDKAKTKTESQRLEWLDLALPSFSGLLPTEADSGKPTPLLQYPLSIVRPSSIDFASSTKLVRFDSNCNKIPMQEVQSLLNKSNPLMSASTRNVRLTAGVSTVVE